MSSSGSAALQRLSHVCHHLQPSPTAPSSPVFIHPYLLTSTPSKSLLPPSPSPSLSVDRNFVDPLASDVDLLRRKMIAIIGLHESPEVARHVTDAHTALSTQYRTSARTSRTCTHWSSSCTPRASCSPAQWGEERMAVG